MAQAKKLNNTRAHFDQPAPRAVGSSNPAVYHSRGAPAKPADQATLRDEWLLKLICSWKVARSEQAIEWAQYDLATAHGTRPAPRELKFDPLDEMKRIEEMLASYGPETVLSAQKLLEVCIDILSHRKGNLDGEHVFSNGPVLEIIMNVLSALECLEPTQVLVREESAQLIDAGA